MKYETVIGLEVHAQLLTQSKIFCSCSTAFGKDPNRNTCPVCLGLPGVLPVLNKSVVEFAIRAGLATHCQIAPRSVFARKNYFYPDLPKGYQISQYELPIATGGFVEIDWDGAVKKIGLTRIHMEEDAGKLLHEHPQSRSKGASWVDLNRAGVPLIEIVSEPDLRSPAEAVAYLKALRALVVSLGVCDGNMEEGSFRCDANISLRPVGEKKFGTRAELKNMNSFRHVEHALEYEIGRQAQLLDNGERVVQESRLWDPETQVTHAMRSKEEAHDYRYFPDPDLLPLLIDAEWIEKVRTSLPELPRAKKERLERAFNLSPAEAETLTSSADLARYFEAVVNATKDPKRSANWVLTELLRELKDPESSLQDCLLQPRHFVQIFTLLDQGTINQAAAKTIFHEIFISGKDADAIVKEMGLSQVSDSAALEAAVDKIIAANPKETERLRAGDLKLMAFFMGQIMKETGGKANPKLVTEILRKKIS